MTSSVTEDWADVEAAVAEVATTYLAYTQSPTKKKRKAWDVAVNQRADALKRHYDMTKDRTMHDGRASLGSVLQRYYAETVVPKDQKGRKRK
jgi:hypothetical protein